MFLSNCLARFGVLKSEVGWFWLVLARSTLYVPYHHTTSYVPFIYSLVDYAHGKEALGLRLPPLIEFLVGITLNIQLKRVLLSDTLHSQNSKRELFRYKNFRLAFRIVHFL